MEDESLERPGRGSKTGVLEVSAEVLDVMLFLLACLNGRQGGHPHLCHTVPSVCPFWVCQLEAITAV